MFDDVGIGLNAIDYLVGLPRFPVLSEKLRMAYRMLKNAGLLPPEVELHKEILRLTDLLDAVHDEEGRRERRQELDYKLMKFNMMRRSRRALRILDLPSATGPGSVPPRAVLVIVAGKFFTTGGSRIGGKFLNPLDDPETIFLWSQLDFFGGRRFDQ